MAVKNYVLDTNVLLHDPNAIFAFRDNRVIIPLYVLEEIDNFKKEMSELGRNARQVARLLDELREQGSLSQGVTTRNGGHLRVALGTDPPLNSSRGRHVMDDLILKVALHVRDHDKASQTILVTKDVNLRVRSDALGLETVDYEPEDITLDELYPGAREIDVPPGDIDNFYEGGKLPPPVEFWPNEYVLLRAGDGSGKTALARYDGKLEALVPVRKFARDSAWGIRPRNKEQQFALDLLLNDDIKLVTLVGKAGTGKTLVALAAGLQKVAEERAYQKLLVSRPVFPLGRDLGYLPGDLEEKLNPWMRPIFDNLELLAGLTPGEKANGRSHREFKDLGYLEIEALTYIRGRSLPRVFMIVDEAQNLTPHEVKTIVTRAGEGTKIVLTGDPYQIDQPYVDASTNGLTTTVERFKKYDISGHVTLNKGERSELAELATRVYA